MRSIPAILAALTLMLQAEDSAPPAGGVDLIDPSAKVSARMKPDGSAEEIAVSGRTFTAAPQCEARHRINPGSRVLQCRSPPGMLERTTACWSVAWPAARPEAGAGSAGKSTVILHRHAFGFGTCVTRGMLTKEGSDGERYRDIVRRTCSRVVFENDLKPDSFPRDAQGFEHLEKSFDWLKANDISVRGHYLIQEAVDGWTRSRLGDPEKPGKPTWKASASASSGSANSGKPAMS